MLRNSETITSSRPPGNGHNVELSLGSNTWTIYKTRNAIPKPTHRTNGTADHDTPSTLQQHQQPDRSSDQCQLQITENGNGVDGKCILYTGGLQHRDNQILDLKIWKEYHKNNISIQSKISDFEALGKGDCTSESSTQQVTYISKSSYMLKTF